MIGLDARDAERRRVARAWRRHGGRAQIEEMRSLADSHRWPTRSRAASAGTIVTAGCGAFLVPDLAARVPALTGWPLRVLRAAMSRASQPPTMEPRTPAKPTGLRSAPRPLRWRRCTRRSHADVGGQARRQPQQRPETCCRNGWTCWPRLGGGRVTVVVRRRKASPMRCGGAGAVALRRPDGAQHGRAGDGADRLPRARPAPGAAPGDRKAALHQVLHSGHVAVWLPSTGCATAGCRHQLGR
jgi:hypothetical protein